jgi:hypothetical protein
MDANNGIGGPAEAKSTLLPHGLRPAKMLVNFLKMYYISSEKPLYPIARVPKKR